MCFVLQETPTPEYLNGLAKAKRQRDSILSEVILKICSY